MLVHCIKDGFGEEDGDLQAPVLAEFMMIPDDELQNGGMSGVGLARQEANWLRVRFRSKGGKSIKGGYK